MMNAPWPQPALGNFKAAAFAQQHVGNRNTDILTAALPMPVRRVIVSKDGQHALNLDAGRVHGPQPHGLVLVKAAALKLPRAGWGQGAFIIACAVLALPSAHWLQCASAFRRAWPSASRWRSKAPSAQILRSHAWRSNRRACSRSRQPT